MTVRVAHITDMHLTSAPGSKLYGVDTAYSLTCVLDSIRQLSRQPDLLLATGDLVDVGSHASYQRLCDLIEPLGIPVYFLPGNHDDVSAMRASFRGERLSFTHAAKFADWGFIFVDSQVPGESHGLIDGDEMALLEENLQSFGSSPVLVALHHTPTSVCPSSGCQLKNAQQFTQLLNSYAGVKAVIAGHTHTDSEVDVGGHRQFTTPSTFAHATHAQLGDPVDHEDFWESHQLDGSTWGYRILDLFADGTIHSEVHWLRDTSSV